MTGQPVRLGKELRHGFSVVRAAAVSPPDDDRAERQRAGEQSADEQHHAVGTWQSKISEHGVPPTGKRGSPDSDDKRETRGNAAS
jgi:hypothetical protein